MVTLNHNECICVREDQSELHILTEVGLIHITDITIMTVAMVITVRRAGFEPSLTSVRSWLWGGTR